MRDRIAAALARRLAATGAARNEAFRASYSAVNFARWIACARRANSLRAALLGHLQAVNPSNSL